MGRNYKFNNLDAEYFVSFAEVEWLEVFTRNRYKDNLLESLQFCQKEKGMKYFKLNSRKRVYSLVDEDETKITYISKASFFWWSWRI